MASLRTQPYNNLVHDGRNTRNFGSRCCKNIRRGNFTKTLASNNANGQLHANRALHSLRMQIEHSIGFQKVYRLVHTSDANANASANASASADARNVNFFISLHLRLRLRLHFLRVNRINANANASAKVKNTRSGAFGNILFISTKAAVIFKSKLKKTNGLG